MRYRGCQNNESFEGLLINENLVKEAYFDEHASHHERVIPHLRKAKRAAKFIHDLDSIYYQYAEVLKSNNTAIFKENLNNLDDFRDKYPHHLPIMNHTKHNHTIESFRSPEEPYLIYEEKFDNLSHRMDRRIRRSPLS